MKTINRSITMGLIVLAAVTLTGCYVTERAKVMNNLFSGKEQYENFNRIVEFMPTSTMTAPQNSYNFPDGEPLKLPKTFSYKGQSFDIENFLQETDTSSILVLEDGKVRLERYMLTGGKDVHWLSMSVAKSFISTGIGIASDEGMIDIDRAITDYVPSLKSSAYDGVSIKNVLQMSSGAAWSEDYTDRNSEALKLAKIMAYGGSLDEFIGSIKPEFEQGTVGRYNSADTQALGMLLTRATGKSITEYLTQKLWHPLGMQADGYWMLDDNNMEMAFAGMNATARDYAKLGELFRLKGHWQGKKLISEQWVHDATHPLDPHVMPGVHEEFPLGYGYQWWLPESSEGEFSAIGVYNQFIYVNPSKNLVIVKLSANSNYATSKDAIAWRELETIAMFRAIGASL